MPTKRMLLLLVGLSLALIAGSIAVVVTEMRGDDSFPWGIHLITIPAVFIVGLIAGWVMRERQLADERARAEIEK